MNVKRRTFLKSSLIIGLFASISSALLIAPRKAFAAWPSTAFAKRSLKSAIADISYGPTIKSTRINITAPNHIENGALVPISITTDIPNIDRISILVDKNTYPLCASFDFHEPCDGYIATRIKMKKTSQVIVVIQAEGKSHQTKKRIKIIKKDC